MPGSHCEVSSTPHSEPDTSRTAQLVGLPGSERCAYAETTGGRLVELKSGLVQGGPGMGHGGEGVRVIGAGLSDLYLRKALWTGCRPEFF